MTGEELPKDTECVWSGARNGFGERIAVSFPNDGEFTEEVNISGLTRRASVVSVDVGKYSKMEWGAFHVRAAKVAKRLGKEALEWSSMMSPYLDGIPHNGKVDAARHAYWCAIMTHDLSSDLAKGASSAYEYDSLDLSPHNEIAMDILNNAVGTTVKGHNRASIQRAVIDALDAGELYILDDVLNIKRAAFLIPSNR